jgi:hypothetical protein
MDCHGNIAQAAAENKILTREDAENSGLASLKSF